MRTRNGFLTVAIVVMLSLLLSVCGGSGGAAPQTSTNPRGNGNSVIKIGALFPFSGNLAKLGQENFAGADIAREIANQQGWVSGKTIEFVKADTPDPGAAASEAARLITQEGIKLVIGTYSSGLALVASQAAEKNGAIHWEISGTSEQITSRGFHHVFRVNAQAHELGYVAADFVSDELSKKLNVHPASLRVALVHEDSAFGTAIGKAVSERAQKDGLRVVADESYNAKSSDLSPMILKLKNARPDVIIATSYLNDAILFWKQAKSLGLNVKAMIGTSAGYSDYDFYQGLSRDAEGVFSSDPPANVNPAGLKPEARALLKEFTDRFQKRTGHEPGPVATLGFVGAVTLFKYVLPHAASLSPDEIRKAVMTVDEPYGTLINGWGIKFDETGQNTRTFAVLNQWQHGKLVVVYPQNLAVRPITMVPLPAWGQR